MPSMAGSLTMQIDMACHLFPNPRVNPLKRGRAGFGVAADFHLLQHK